MSDRYTPPTPPRRGAPRRVQDAYLRRAFRFHSRTFSLATRLLRREVRLPVAVLYLFCRTVDTLADERVLEVGQDEALRELDRLRASLDAALAGRPPEGLLWERLAETHARFGLLRDPLFELTDGAEWDLRARPIRTSGDLVAYSELVAGSVGAMMLPFLVRDRADIDRLEAPARALGNAMQITNILRDVGEDWQQLGRVYLPSELLDRHGFTPTMLARAVEGAPPGPAYAPLMEDLMVLAERFYNEGEAGIAALPLRSRLGIAAAGRMYREILNEVRASGYDNLARRNRVDLGRKLRLVAHDDYARRKARLVPQALLVA